jgi:hypothetical protein
MKSVTGTRLRVVRMSVSFPPKPEQDIKKRAPDFPRFAQCAAGLGSRPRYFADMVGVLRSVQAHPFWQLLLGVLLIYYSLAAGGQSPAGGISCIPPVPGPDWVCVGGNWLPPLRYADERRIQPKHRILEPR